jgi:asparagine synthase (glutamine-hydrolysing)
MFRYIALAWRADDAAQSAAARVLMERLQSREKSWGRVEESNGLSVLAPTFRHGSLEVHRLPEGQGMLIGALYPRLGDPMDESAAPRFIPNARQSKQIVRSRGRWLIEHTWGNYVALLRDPADRRTWLLKDPTGNLPCLRTSFRGVHVMFGDVADLVATGLFRFTIGERYLQARLIHGGVLDQPPLNEVDTVSRGACIELSDRPNESRDFYWRPLTFVDPSIAIEDADVAARAMRATLRSCTRTLRKDHENILHRLSGGLDSSIVAACLANAPSRAELTCYTYYIPSGRSDERPWARLVAGHHGLSHEEHASGPDLIPLPALLDMPPMSEPTAGLGYLLRSTLEQRLAENHRATAVFCGDGGDSGFCGDTFAYAVSEYLKRHGLRSHAWRLASRVAALTEESSWSVMMKSLRRWRRGPGMEHQRKLVLATSRLLEPDVRASYSETVAFPHPWLKDLQPIPWSLVRRLGTLLATPEFYNVAANVDAPEIIAPLYCQPMMELLLRIPVDVHFENGRERGLARRAFASDLPAEVVRRTWKDRVPGFMDQLVARHRSFLREQLLDGVLVQAHLLNRKAVEEVLSDRVISSASYPGELLRHLDVELWARHWQPAAANARAVGST